MEKNIHLHNILFIYLFSFVRSFIHSSWTVIEWKAQDCGISYLANRKHSGKDLLKL